MFSIQIRKPTSMPGESTTITAVNINSNDLGDLRLHIGRVGKAIDWRVSSENDKKLSATRQRLRKLNVQIPGF